MRAKVTTTEAVRRRFDAAPADQQQEILAAIEDLEADATQDALVMRPPVVFHRKVLRGLDILYYVADLSGDPLPVQIIAFDRAN